ncbi:hypothetical protein QFZ24_005356 [Streptomyces phaeochromogenes]|nr:hypothetical protein [Streptomyces phaeochromogenes]
MREMYETHGTKLFSTSLSMLLSMFLRKAGF